MIDFYKLYIKKEDGTYDKPIIIKSFKEVLNKVSNLKCKYLIIGRDTENRMDVLVTTTKCDISFEDNIKTNIEVKATTFKPKEFEKETKRNRAKRKREFQKEIENYIDR